MALTSLEAYDLLRFGRAFLDRLLAAQRELEVQSGCDDELEWLRAAARRLESELPSSESLDDARLLPELEELHDEALEQLQNDWVDVVEKLHAGITFHAGSRSPVIEALFPHLKFPNLRRASTETATAYLQEFERKLKGGYVVRMFATEDFAFARPVLEALKKSTQRWRDFDSGAIQIDADSVREMLHRTAARTERLLRQSRLLAEAALVPFPEIYAGLELGAKMRRRVGRGVVPGAEGFEDGALDAEGLEGLNAADEGSDDSGASELESDDLTADGEETDNAAPADDIESAVDASAGEDAAAVDAESPTGSPEEVAVKASVPESQADESAPAPLPRSKSPKKKARANAAPADESADSPNA